MARRPITTATATPTVLEILNVVTPMGKEVVNTLSTAVVMAHIMVNNQWPEFEERTIASVDYATTSEFNPYKLKTWLEFSSQVSSL